MEADRRGRQPIRPPRPTRKHSELWYRRRGQVPHRKQAKARKTLRPSRYELGFWPRPHSATRIGRKPAHRLARQTCQTRDRGQQVKGQSHPDRRHTLHVRVRRGSPGFGSHRPARTGDRSRKRRLPLSVGWEEFSDPSARRVSVRTGFSSRISVNRIAPLASLASASSSRADLNDSSGWSGPDPAADPSPNSRKGAGSSRRVIGPISVTRPPVKPPIRASISFRSADQLTNSGAIRAAVSRATSATARIVRRLRTEKRAPILFEGQERVPRASQ